MIDKEKFLFLYQGNYGTLEQAKFDGLSNLIDFINADPNVTNISWISYMLATTKHETANTWLPIAEYGKGKGKSYGIPDKSGKTFYGRGFVQLTWADNYKALGKALGVDLYANPDLAMDPHTAYSIMSYGMRRGAFTGVGLSKYINETKCDYLNARRIINGTDCAAKIAAYAVTLEEMLRESINENS